jgi:hypothetical protein
MYEHRAFKYSRRGFCVAIPGLEIKQQPTYGDDSVQANLLNIYAKMLETPEEQWNTVIKQETSK